MSHKPLYILLGCAFVVALGWLHRFIIPDLVVVTVDPSAKIQTGYVFGHVSHVSEKLTLDDYIMLKSSARGWSGLFAWWPFAVASAVAGGVFAWFLGRSLQVNEHAEAAKADKEYANQRLEEADSKRLKAESALSEAHRLNSKTAQYRSIAEQAKASAAEAAAAQAEAERKLLAERDRHKEEMAKAGARIKELKEKAKKNKLVDEV